MESQEILTGVLPLPIGHYSTPQFHLQVTQWGVWGGGGSLHDDGSRFDPDTAETLEAFDVTNWTPEQFARLREFVCGETRKAGFAVSNTAKQSQIGKMRTGNRDKPGPHRAALELWKAGLDLREVYSRTTYFRHKRYLLENFGVDISTPYQEGC